jgi:hypothetical protein
LSTPSAWRDWAPGRLHIRHRGVQAVTTGIVGQRITLARQLQRKASKLTHFERSDQVAADERSAVCFCRSSLLAERYYLARQQAG